MQANNHSVQEQDPGGQNRKRLSPSRLALVVAGVMLLGCSASGGPGAEPAAQTTPAQQVSTAASEPTPVPPTPTPAQTTAPAAQTTAPAAPTAVPEATPDPHPGWATYTNTDYGFSIRYPVAWGLIELPAGRETAGGAAAAEIRLMREGLRIVIQVKEETEPYIIGPSGRAAGEVVERGTLAFLGQGLPRYVLIYEGKDKAVFTGGSIDTLIFHISLEEDPNPELAYGATALPPEAQAEMLAILATGCRWRPGRSCITIHRPTIHR